MNVVEEIQGKWSPVKVIKKPTRGPGRPNIYPFKSIKVGESFTHPVFNTAVTLCYYWHAKLGHCYEAVQLGVGARIKRVK